MISPISICRTSDPDVEYGTTSLSSDCPTDSRLGPECPPSRWVGVFCLTKCPPTGRGGYSVCPMERGMFCLGETQSHTSGVVASAWRRVAPAIFIRQKAKEQLIYAKTRSSSEMKAKPSLICKIATPEDALVRYCNSQQCR